MVCFLLLWIKTQSIECLHQHMQIVLLFFLPSLLPLRFYWLFLLFQFLTASMGFVPELYLGWEVKVFKVRDPPNKQILLIFAASHAVVWHVVIKLSAFPKSSFQSVWDGEGEKIEMSFLNRKTFLPCTVFIELYPSAQSKVQLFIQFILYTYPESGIVCITMFFLLWNTGNHL